MLKEFREFALKGNMLDLAIGVILGAVTGAVVSSLVDDLVSPLLGLLFSGDFSNLFLVLKEGTKPGPYASVAEVKEAGAIAIRYGLFMNSLIKFLLTAFALFLIVKAMNKFKKAEEPAAPAEPPAEEKLLTEIRDLLANKQG